MKWQQEEEQRQVQHVDLQLDDQLQEEVLHEDQRLDLQLDDLQLDQLQEEVLHEDLQQEEDGN